MKFCKKYEEYMQVQKQKKNLPGVGFKKLKKILKRCRRNHVPSRMASINRQHDHNCSRECPVCDGTFFPELLKEMEDVVGWFNENAQKLLELHLASRFKKCLTWLRGNSRKRDHLGLIQEGKDLVNYALINAVAIRKILKKYDKIHESRQGQLFKTQVQKMRIEILQSPWLCELMAFHVNLKDSQKESGAVVASPPPPVHALFAGCSLTFEDGKPYLSCELSDSVKVDIDLTCSICLDMVFDPISLTCGHIYCYMCACSAASVNVVDGLKATNPTEKCPLCREGGVYKGAVHLDELNILLKRSCREYWDERRKTERAERVQQAKDYWDYQCRSFTGI